MRIQDVPRQSQHLYGVTSGNRQSSETADQEELFGPMIVDLANLGEHSSGTHVAATIAGSSAGGIQFSPRAEQIALHSFNDTGVDLNSFQSMIKSQAPVAMTITSNSWGSDHNSQSLLDAFKDAPQVGLATIKTDEPGYIIVT